MENSDESNVEMPVEEESLGSNNCSTTPPESNSKFQLLTFKKFPLS